jgi:hypothetical protein
MNHGLKFGRRKGETPKQAARGRAIATAAAKTRQRAMLLEAYVASARDGARIVAISSKKEAAHLHAALRRMNVGTRDGDVWRVGAGTIEVRA